VNNGVVHIRPYEGQGTDSAILFMQGVLDYRERHALQMGHVYEVFVQGVGNLFITFIELIAQILGQIPNFGTSPSREKVEYARPWIMNCLDATIDEGQRMSRQR